MVVLVLKDYFTGTQIGRTDIQYFVNNNQELNNLSKFSLFFLKIFPLLLKELKDNIKSNTDKSVLKYVHPTDNEENCKTELPKKAN